MAKYIFDTIVNDSVVLKSLAVSHWHSIVIVFLLVVIPLVMGSIMVLLKYRR